jgi:hypothetical protein
MLIKPPENTELNQVIVFDARFAPYAGWHDQTGFVVDDDCHDCSVPDRGACRIEDLAEGVGGVAETDRPWRSIPERP